MSKQLIRNTISNSSFWQVNKFLARLTDNDTAILLADLVSKHEYFENKNELDENGGFFNTVENIEKDCNIKKDKQIKCLSKLKKLKLIETYFKGMPKKRYYLINYNEIIKLLSCSLSTKDVGNIDDCMSEKSTKDVGNIDINNNKDNNNKINNNKINNNKYNKVSKKGQDSFDKLIDDYTQDKELKETILEYIKMRINKKAKPTNKALELIFKKLDKFSNSAPEKIKILEQSILNNWTDIYELKEKKGENNASKINGGNNKGTGETKGKWDEFGF